MLFSLLYRLLQTSLMHRYCDMRIDSWNSGARETVVAKQRLCKQATIPEPSLGNESASNNGWTVRGGVLCSVRAETIHEGHLDKPRVCSESEYEVGVRWSLACEDVSPEVEEWPVWATRLRTLVCVWQWFVRCSHDLYECPINPIINPNPAYNHSIAWHYYLLSLI
jgi:hypothetical protein